MNRRELLKTSLFGAAAAAPGFAAPAFGQAAPPSAAPGCEDCFVKEIALAMPSAPRLKVTASRPSASRATCCPGIGRTSS